MRGDEMIYTSYFGNIKKILAAVPDAKFISIAGKTPNWFVGEKFSELAPKYSWWQEWHDKFDGDYDSNESKLWYKDKYYETVLSNLKQLDVAQKLKALADWCPTFILCYETPEKFCHRHLVAEWLNARRVECKEWSN